MPENQKSQQATLTKSKGPKKPVLVDYPSIQRVLKGIEKQDTDDDFKAYLFLLLLSGKRAGEIQKIGPKNLKNIDGLLCLSLNILKRRDDFFISNLPIGPLIGEEPEAKAARFILAHSEKKDKEAADRLFKRAQRTYRWKMSKMFLNKARIRKDGQVIEADFPFHPHLMRHIRATDLVERGYSLLQLKAFQGYSRTDSALPYLHQDDIKALRDKMRSQLPHP